MEKEQDTAHSSSLRLDINGEAGDDGVMKMWIERVSDILYVKSNKLTSLVIVYIFIPVIITNLHSMVVVGGGAQIPSTPFYHFNFGSLTIFSCIVGLTAPGLTFLMTYG